MMPFSDIQLSRRLEGAEGHACVRYAESRRGLFPDSAAEWIQCAGAVAVFDGPGSPITQSFGLGIFEDVSPSSLDRIENFFFERGAAADHEVSPFAGITTLNLLCTRNYQPIEISTVLCQPIKKFEVQENQHIRVRAVGSEEAQLWTDINVKGWSHGHPELLDFLQRSSAISAVREQTVCFLAEVDGRPGAAGSLCLHQGVALFAGAATVPELRCRGLQTALLRERLRYAFDHGCDLAMMVAEAGSSSQRNSERQGFRIAYTRLKWRLSCPPELNSKPQSP